MKVSTVPCSEIRLQDKTEKKSKQSAISKYFLFSENNLRDADIACLCNDLDDYCHITNLLYNL